MINEESGIDYLRNLSSHPQSYQKGAQALELHVLVAIYDELVKLREEVKNLKSKQK